MIELTEITPELIGNFLKTYEATSETVHDLVNSLQWLAHHRDSPERAFQLYYRLEAWTLQELESEASLAGVYAPIADAITDPIAFLRGTFGHRNSALEKWAAVYLRYFAQYSGTIKATCATAGVNVRRFYRRRDEGLDALTRLVILAEVQARQEIQNIRLFDRLPPPDHGTLVGREQLVLELRQMFDDPHGPRMISLEGIAGVGKTAIARQLAADLAHYNLMSGLAWVNLRPARRFSTGPYVPGPRLAWSVPDIISAITTQLGFGEITRGLPPEEQISLLRDRLLTPYYLVVLDGLEMLDDAGALLALLRPLTLRVLFVFTTRRSLGIHHGVAIIPISGLTESQSVQVLKEECARYQVNCELAPQQMQVLRDFSAGSPGFLCLIARHLRESSAQEILEFIEQRRLPVSMLDELSHWFEPQLLKLAQEPGVHADSLTVITALCCAIANRDKRDWLQFVTDLPDDRYYPAENALAAHYFVMRHASSFDAGGIYAPPVLRAYLHGQLLRLWESGLWDTTAAHQSKLRWLIRVMVRLRRALRRTARHLEQVSRATLLDGHEMDRYYALLNAAHYWESLADPAIDIILRLHPLPIYNGDWAVWEHEIGFATQELGKRGRIPEQVALLVDLQTMHFQAGRWARVVEIFQQCLALGTAHHLPLPVARTLYMLVHACYYMDRQEEALRQVEAITHSPLITAAAGDEGRLTQTWLCLTRAVILRGDGQQEAALQETKEAEAHFHACAQPDITILGQIRQHQGLMYWVMGQYATAEDHLHEALDIFSMQDDIFSQAFVEGNLGLLYWSTGQLGEAENHILGSLHTARLHGADWHLTTQTGMLALILLYRGELSMALERMEEHYRLALRLNASHEVNRATINRGVVYFHLNRIQDALESLRKGLAIRGISPMGRACMQLYLARCYALRGHISSATPYLDQVQHTVELTGSAPLQIILNRVRAEITPDKARAQAWLQEALILAEDLGREYDRAACLLALAGLQEKREKQQLYWDSARGALTLVEASRWLAGATLRKLPRLPTLI